MQAFELSQLITEREQSEHPYLEFLRVPSLSMGLYVLPASGVDSQQPHTEDEVYYIVRGRMWVGEEDRPVEAGSILFVPANAEHRFHAITEALTILVFFAPAEYARAQEPGISAG